MEKEQMKQMGMVKDLEKGWMKNQEEKLEIEKETRMQQQIEEASGYKSSQKLVEYSLVTNIARIANAVQVTI